MKEDRVDNIDSKNAYMDTINENTINQTIKVFEDHLSASNNSSRVSDTLSQVFYPLGGIGLIQSIVNPNPWVIGATLVVGAVAVGNDLIGLSIDEDNEIVSDIIDDLKDLKANKTPELSSSWRVAQNIMEYIDKGGSPEDVSIGPSDKDTLIEARFGPSPV
jgi:hypothetical protein